MIENFNEKLVVKLRRMYKKQCGSYMYKANGINWEKWFVRKYFNDKIYRQLFEYYLISGIRKIMPVIDRVDNSKGYIRENIQVLTYSQNSQKAVLERLKDELGVTRRSFTYNELLEAIAKIKTKTLVEYKKDFKKFCKENKK